MFKLKDSDGSTIIRFNERGEWEFSIDREGYIELLVQADIDLGKVDGGKPIKKYATQDRAMEVIKEITQKILNAQRGKGAKFYIMPSD